MKRNPTINYILTILSCLIGSDSTQGNSDIFSLDDFSYSSHTRHYNALPSVEEANKQIRAMEKFDPFLTIAEKIITRYDLESQVGLRLIHSHFSLPENSIMVENDEEFQGIPSLVTCAHSSEEVLKKKALPSSWIFKTAHLEDIQFFEASSDQAVHEGTKTIAKEPEFIEEMGKALVTHDLNSLLSVAVLKRSFLEPTHEKQQFIEINNASPNKSVVQLWDINRIPENIIQTSWSFKGPRQQVCYPVSLCTPQLGLGHWHRVIHKKWVGSLATHNS